jgi:hypothetical protein
MGCHKIYLCFNQTPTPPARTQNSCVDHIPPMPERTENISQLELKTPIPWNACEDTKCISTCADQTTPMPARRKICISTCDEHTPTKTARNQIANSSHANEDTKCISTCFDQQQGNKMTPNMCCPHPTMPLRTQNAFQHVLTKPHPCQRGHKMNLNLI